MDVAAPELEPEQVVAKELFYTEGPPALKTARMQIAQCSLKRAALRISSAKRRRTDPDEDEKAAHNETGAFFMQTCLYTVYCASLKSEILILFQKSPCRTKLKTNSQSKF